MAKTWVLLRGLGRESKHWGSFVEDMQAEFPEDEILCLDLPGAGEFYREKCPLSISGMVSFLSQKLSEKKPSYPVQLLSVSLGGMIALQWAQQKPQEVERLVVINTSLASLNPFYERLRWQVYPRFLLKNMWLKGAKREENILSVISNKKEIHKSLAVEWEQIAKERPVQSENVLRQLFAASQFKFSSQLSQPCLILVGKKDRLVSADCSEQLHKRFNWPIEKHPTAGHDLTTDDGPWVARTVKKWFE